MLKTFLKTFLTWLIVIIGFFAVGLSTAPNVSYGDNYGRPNAIGSAPWLIEKHDCWTNEKPADMTGKMPTHVVYRKNDWIAPKYAGKSAVDLAFDQIFNGNDHDLTVFAFCR